MWDWWKSLISGECPIEVNAPKELLIEKIIQSRHGRLTADGAICFESLEEGITLQFNQETFLVVKQELMKLITLMKPTIFISDKMLGDDFNPLLGLRVITTSPYMALQCEVLYNSNRHKSFMGELTVYQWSLAGFPWKELGLPSPVIRILNPDSKELILLGDSSFQEFKVLCMNFMKSLLSQHRFALVEASASFDEKGQLVMFVGHKGSGKSTLARMPGFSLYADDQVVMTEKKILRVERGSFSNLESFLNSDLKMKFGDILEGGRLEDFSREMISQGPHDLQNCFVTFSMAHSDRRAKFPQVIFFLCQDETGALPAVSKLSGVQAQQFANKYLGLHPIQCERLSDVKIRNCWLINTGYYGGPINIGKRFPLAFTKACIHSILSGGADHFNYFELPGPSLLVPHEIRGVRSGLFNPLELWTDSSAYAKAIGAWARFFRPEPSMTISDLSHTP